MDYKKIIVALLAVTMTGAFTLVPSVNERNAEVLAAEETEDFSWLPHSDEEYNEFTEKYSTVACLNGYIILSEDPCADGGYSITETHEGTAEYSLYKEYNVRTGALAPGTSALPVKIYKPEKSGVLKITWKKERTWSETEPAIWEAVKYYSVADDLSVKEITEEEYNSNSENTSSDGIYPTDFKEYSKAIENNPDFYISDGKTVYFLNSSQSSAEQKLLINTSDSVEVRHDTYGYIFTPAQNGSYIISSDEYHEYIVDADSPEHDHRYEHWVTNYMVKSENGEISVTMLGRYGNKYDEKEKMIFESQYNAFSGGQIKGNHYFRYICSELNTDVQLVMKARYSSDEDADVAAVQNADLCVIKKYVSSGSISPDFIIATPDMMNYYVISAAEGASGQIILKDKKNDETYSVDVKDGQIVPGTLKPAELTDTDIVKGDCNNDGVVSAADIVALIRYLTGRDEEIYAGADVNSDGSINVIDLCNLKSMILAD